MTDILDDTLRIRLRELTDVDPPAVGDIDRDVRRRAHRRRTRRRLLQAGCAVIVLLGVGAGVLAATASDDDRLPPATTAAPPPPPTTADAPSGEAAGLVEVHLVTDGERGNVRATLRFDRPLRDGSVRMVDGWSAVTGNGIEYLVQPMDETQTCGATHWFPASGQHSLDVLIPAAWVTADQADLDFSHEGQGLEKYVICPPRDGVVQIAFWGMGPERGHEEVSVSVTEDGRTIVVDNP